METKRLDLRSYCADAQYTLLRIINRLGWCIDEDEEPDIYFINVPFADLDMYELLEASFEM